MTKRGLQTCLREVAEKPGENLSSAPNTSIFRDIFFRSIIRNNVFSSVMQYPTKNKNIEDAKKTE